MRIIEFRFCSHAILLLQCNTGSGISAISAGKWSVGDLAGNFDGKVNKKTRAYKTTFIKNGGGQPPQPKKGKLTAHLYVLYPK